MHTIDREDVCHARISSWAWSSNRT